MAKFKTRARALDLLGRQQIASIPTALNELIKIGKYLLKILFVVSIASLIFLGSYLLKDWGILRGILNVLKIISPFFIGIIIAWLLDPIVSLLQKKGASRAISVAGVFTVFIFLIVLFFWMVIPTLVDQLQDAIGIVPGIVDDINSWIDNLFNDLNNLYNYDFSSIQENIYLAFEEFSNSITVGLPTILVDAASNVISGGLNVIIGLFIGFYMLFDFNNVRKELLNFIPKKAHSDTIELTDRLNNSLKSYVQGTLFVTLILFTVQSIGFTLAGLKAPVVFGLICAITNIIPYVGPYIGGVPAVVVGFTISPLVGLLSLIAVVVSQFLESYVLTPVVMSKTMKLHPVTIIIGLLIFGHFFGILGMILSTPIISCLKIIFNFFDEKYELFEKIQN